MCPLTKGGEAGLEGRREGGGGVVIFAVCLYLVPGTCFRSRKNSAGSTRKQKQNYAPQKLPRSTVDTGGYSKSQDIKQFYLLCFALKSRPGGREGGGG